MDPASPGYRTMLQLLARANKELTRIDLARLQGDFGYQPTDPVFRSALTAPPTPRRDGTPRVDDRRVPSGIVLVNCSGLHW